MVSFAWTVEIGAALTSLLFTAGKFVIGFYIGKSVSASAYGAASSLVVGRCMDLLLRVDSLFWRGIHASLRAHDGFATQRRKLSNRDVPSTA